jgi:hypothetical protein
VDDVFLPTNAETTCPPQEPRLATIAPLVLWELVQPELGFLNTGQGGWGAGIWKRGSLNFCFELTPATWLARLERTHLSRSWSVLPLSKPDVQYIIEGLSGIPSYILGKTNDVEYGLFRGTGKIRLYLTCSDHEAPG